MDALQLMIVAVTLIIAVATAFIVIKYRKMMLAIGIIGAVLSVTMFILGHAYTGIILALLSFVLIVGTLSHAYYLKMHRRVIEEYTRGKSNQ